MKLRAMFIAAAVLLMPTAALAAPGIVTTTVSLKAGPGAGFPTVDRIPGGDRVNIHGCLKGIAWCDVSWSDDRGWVSSQYLQYLYRDRYVYLPDYVDEIDVPVVPFVLTSYWSSYYAGRPWYQRRTHWSGYWRSHERSATRLTIDRSAARIGRAAAARDAARPEGKARAKEHAKERVGVEERSRARVGERTREGVTERVTREKDIAPRSAREGRDRTAVQPRMTRENARMRRDNARTTVREHPTARARTQTPPMLARGHDEPRAAAPRIDPVTIAAIADAPRITDRLSDEGVAHFERVQAGLRALAVPFRLEPRLVRGLDYYTHTTFEVVSTALDAAQSTIGGGGRYDGLVEDLGGPATAGIGFGSGIERVLLTCDAEGVFAAADDRVDVFVVDTAGGDSARDLSVALRRAGIAAERAFDGRSMKSQMKSADRSGAALGAHHRPRRARGGQRHHPLDGGRPRAAARRPRRRRPHRRRPAAPPTVAVSDAHRPSASPTRPPKDQP